MTDFITEPVTLKDKVQKGANYLDQKLPNWHNSVNPLTLDMHDMKNCVLGQLTGEFGKALHQFKEPWNWVADNGFILPVYLEEINWHNIKTKYLALTELWKYEIEKRNAPS